MEVKEKVKEFLQKKIGQDKSFSLDDNIFKQGLVNSLFALELVVFLENTFSIAVENEDLNLENFNSVNNIDNFIARKKA
ncbi:MAG: hypothetical protein K0R65_3 [Crocinitomicaceae bacterium]|jgi:acyl carrier protein|nr:hypothetical protein [Crocinitomicaceae bacterium]